MTGETPVWAEEVEKGWKAEIFGTFDKEGEIETERLLPTYGQDYRAHAIIWLRLVREKREREDRERQVRSGDLTERATIAAENSATSARLANSHARGANKIALGSMVVAVVSLVVAFIALFRNG